MTSGPVTPYERWGKRLIDVSVAAVLTLTLLPLFCVIALVVWATLGRPLLFCEARAGRGGTPFTLRKFRTMSHECDADGKLLPDARRLTPVGRVLRQWSLDELPELLHVISGEMSLVGPRPLPVSYVARYSSQQARRLHVKPGITGLAQVRGRNALDWAERFALDAWYVDHRGVALDLKLLLMTLVVVVTREGVSHPGHATMHEFLGPVQQ